MVLCSFVGYKPSFACQVNTMIEGTSYGDKQIAAVLFPLVLQGVQHRIEWG